MSVRSVFPALLIDVRIKFTCALCRIDYGKWYWASLRAVRVSTGFINAKMELLVVESQSVLSAYCP